MSNRTLAQKFAALTSAVSWSGWLLTRLEREGWRPTYCSDEQVGGFFWLHIQTLSTAQHRFELAPELLLLLCRSHVQQQFLVQVRVAVAAARGRVDSSVFVVVDPKPHLHERLQTLHAPGCVVGWGKDDKRRLLDAIAAALPTSDPFDVRRPVSGRDRVGREGMVSGLIRDLPVHPAIGVFGLRKMGKTTVINAAIEKLDPERQGRLTLAAEGRTPAHPWLVCAVDAQMYLDSGMVGLCGAITTAIRSRCGFASPARPGSPIATLRWAIEQAMSYSHRVCLVVDEFDWLLAGGNAYTRDAVTLLAVLRGMTSTWAERFRVVFVGRLPDRLNGATVLGASNPMFNQFRPFWVGPLERREADELLIRLGKRAGLTVGTLTQGENWRLAVGHPLMSRLYGSAVLRRLQGEIGKVVDQNIPTDGEAVAASRDLLRGDDARAHFEEIKDLLKEIKPAAISLLQDLALDLTGERWNEAQDVEHEEALLLVRFGLVERDTGQVPEVVAHFFRPLPKRTMRVA